MRQRCRHAIRKWSTMALNVSKLMRPVVLSDSLASAIYSSMASANWSSSSMPSFLAVCINVTKQTLLDGTAMHQIFSHSVHCS